MIPIASLWGTAALAQDVPLATPPGFEQGADLGYAGFTFYNRLQTGFEGTSNIRQDPSEEGDTRSIVTLDSVIRSAWERHALAATASYVRQEATETPDLKSVSLSGTISGRLDIGSQWAVIGGLLHTESIIGQNDPQQFSGNLQGTTVEDTAEGGINWKGESYYARLLARHTEVYNETDIDTTVLARVQVQDRIEMDATAQVGRMFDWGEAYVFGGPVWIDYSGSAVILPEDRDSFGYRGGVGLEGKMGPVQGIVRIAGFSQDYDAPTIGRASSFFGTAQLSWQVTERLSVAGKVQRSFDETDIETSAGLFTNLFAAGFLYRFTDDVYLRTGPSYRYYQIEGTTMRAESISLDGMLAWQVHPRIELMINGTVMDQTVNDPSLANLEYSESAITFSTVLTF